MEPNIKELKIKIIVAFALAITSLQLLVLGSPISSLLNFSYSFGSFTNSLTTLLVIGMPISMNIVSLVFINQAKSVNGRPYRIFKRFAYGLSIASLVIYGIVLTFTFFIALISGELFALTI